MNKNQYPKWEELPELDLYLDQVLLYVNQLINPKTITNDKLLTASMINNYVKHNYISKPIKKKYNRRQVARLIVITAFKQVFAIQEISQTLEILTADNHSEEAYNGFAACMNKEEAHDLPPVVISACQTLNLYQETQKLVLELGGKNKNA
ncbi:TPA: DUF1836 domain-containing protein [Streptococcus agalactiae]